MNGPQVYIEADQLEIIASYVNYGLLLDEDITAKLLTASRILKMPSLVRKCTNHLVLNICVDNIMEILVSAYWAKEEKLATTTWDFLVVNAEKVKPPDGWDLQGYFEFARKPLWYASQDFGAVYQLQMLVTRRSENSASHDA